MKYFVNPNSGELRAFDPDADEAFIPKGLNSISQAEFKALVAAKTPAVHPAQQIAAARFEHEIAGILVDGVPYETGRDSQAMVAGAALSAVIDPGYVCNWKTRSGPVRLDATKLIAVAIAVRNHVQACFDREKDLLLALDAGSFVESMLTEGWP